MAWARLTPKAVSSPNSSWPLLETSAEGAQMLAALAAPPDWSNLGG